MDGTPNKRPDSNKHYDIVIVGSGLAGLSFAALMAKKGKKICILEAHDIPGGYGHSFKMGDFYFCAQIHYIWGCQEGGTINQWLKFLGLEKEITFEEYDRDCFDKMVIPGHTLDIPFGHDNLIANCIKEFPNEEKGIRKFVNILKGITYEVNNFPPKLTVKDYITRWHHFPHLLKYKNCTLKDVFEQCKLSIELQTLLAAQAGDFMMPPKELSVLSYNGLMSGYMQGTYYPTNHYKGAIERIVKFITDHEGCDIFYETPVVAFETKDKEIVSVKTKHGDVVKGDLFISNADPKMISKMIGLDKFPKSYHTKVDYEYTDSPFNIYLGVKGLDLRKLGFSSYNIWHCEQPDMDKMWDEMRQDDYSKAWYFFDFPTLHSDAPGVAPEGCDIINICTFAPYKVWKEVKDRDYNEYLRKKLEFAKWLIDDIEEKYIPGLKKHIVMRVVGSPTTSEYWAIAPEGNSYGEKYTPASMVAGRLGFKTPFNNLFWCNATAGYGGFHSTIGTGAELYREMTGEVVIDKTDPNIGKYSTFRNWLHVMLKGYSKNPPKVS